MVWACGKNGYRMARIVLMTEVESGYNGDRVRLDGWQQRNDGGGCASMRERSERVESPGTYN